MSRAVIRTLEIAAVVVLGLLVWRNSVLQGQLKTSVARQSRALSVGQQLNQLPVADLQGRSRQLDLRSARSTLVLIDPDCDSCTKVLSRLTPASGVHVVSIGTPERAKGVVEKYGLLDQTSVLRHPMPAAIAQGIRTFPQVVVVERGTIVRTCLNAEECGIGS